MYYFEYIDPSAPRPQSMLVGGAAIPSPRTPIGRPSCRAGPAASERFAILKGRLVACGKVDAGAVKKIVPDSIRLHDHRPLAFAHDAHLLDALRKRQALRQA